MNGDASEAAGTKWPFVPGSTRLAAVAVSRLGSELAGRLVDGLQGTTAYVPARFASAAGSGESPKDRPVQEYEGKVATVIAVLFRQRLPLVLVMATGAAVRLVAPLLTDKSVDPAVVVVDDAGRFAISLLSGHAGGANQLARRVATALDACPVITTASEAAGVPAIDRIAAAYGWKIEPGKSLTRLAAALVNGERVGIYQDAGARGWLEQLPATVQVFESIDALANAKPAMALIVSDCVQLLPAALESCSVIYRPPVLVLGVGCSRGASAREIESLIDQTLAREGLSPLAVWGVATIDRRLGEPGLRDLLVKRTWPMVTFSAAQLDKTEGDWMPSDVVQRAVGTRGVCEPAALACAGVSSLAVRKVKGERVTLAIARRASELPMMTATSDEVGDS